MGTVLKEIADAITQNIDEITRRWVDDLRQNPRTEIHKQLLSADIVDGVKGMLASLAQALEARETPELGGGDWGLGVGNQNPTPNPHHQTPSRKFTRPLSGPLT